MNIAILGDGRLGSEIGAVLGDRSGIRPLILGRPNMKPTRPSGRYRQTEISA